MLLPVGNCTVTRYNIFSKVPDCDRGEDDGETERRLVDDMNRGNLIPWDLNCGGRATSTEQESRGRHAHAYTHAAQAAAIAPDPRSAAWLSTVAYIHTRADHAFSLAKGESRPYPAKMLGRQFRGRICARRCSSSRSIRYPRTGR